ncbi:MAG TPA: TolC family protein [Oligoflexia bacterium]|nr:TolC family protein [Oligoflexia bacterium]HMP49119.1 TolC family protein [Oligoflexia bacterium]
MNLFSCVLSRVLPVCVLVVSYGSILVAESREPECQKTLSLDEFRAISLKNSPLIAEIDRDYANDLATAFDTEVLTNPELQVEQTFTGMKLNGDNDGQSQVSIGQPIRLSNFGSRQRVASLIRKSGDAQKRSMILELTQKLNIQFRTLFILQETRKILIEAEKKASEKVTLINDGVTKGLFSLGEEKLFEGEKYRLQAQVKGVVATIANTQNELAKSTGFTCSIVTTGYEPLRELPSEESLISKARNSEFSESARMNLYYNLSKEETRLSELDAFPVISPRFLYQHTNDGGDFFGAGVSIPLPFWNSNQGERVRKSAEERVLKVKNTFLANGGLESQISNLRQSAISLSEQSELFSSKVIPSFEGALKSQEKLYSKGQGNILQVWQTLRALNEVQTQGLLLWLEANSARTQLSILIGEEI